MARLAREPAPNSVPDELGIRFDAECLHHRVLVMGYGSRRNAEHGGHLLHRFTLGEKLQNFPLPWREAWSGAPRLHALEHRLGHRRRDVAAPESRLPDGLDELRRGAVLEQEADPRGRFQSVGSDIGILTDGQKDEPRCRQDPG